MNIRTLPNWIHYENILCTHTFIPYVQFYVDSNIIITVIYLADRSEILCAPKADALILLSLQLRVRKAEPVERSRMRISIVQAVTSHVRFQNGKIEK